MDKPDTSHEERRQIADKARLIGDTVAFVAGRDVASADSAGRTAVENNYLGHSLGLQFARQEIVNDETLSDAEKRQRLAEVDELAQQTVLAAGKGAALGLAGTVAVAAAPAINTAGLATSAYLMSNPTGMKVASLATKGAVTLGTGILAYDYGKTAVNRGFGAAFHRMQEDAALMMTVPSEVFANAAKSASPSVPKEVTAAKTLVQESRPILTESTAAQPVMRVYQPTPEQSALSLQYGNKGMKGIVQYEPLVKDAPARHTEQIIGGRRYGGHAIDRMQERGIPISAVENTITTGQKLPAKQGRLQYYDKTNNITVITESNGDVVTVRYGEK